MCPNTVLSTDLSNISQSIEKSHTEERVVDCSLTSFWGINILFEITDTDIIISFKLKDPTRFTPDNFLGFPSDMCELDSEIFTTVFTIINDMIETELRADCTDASADFIFYNPTSDVAWYMLEIDNKESIF